MNLTDGVVWHTADSSQRGRLIIGEDLLKLAPFDDPDTILAELRFDDICAVEHEPAATRGRPAVVFASREGARVEIECIVDRLLLSDLLERTLAHVIAGAARRRILISVRLRPGGRERTIELLRAGPPFELSRTSIVAHDVFQLGDDVLFLFETDDRDAAERETPLWDTITAWDELIAEIRVADEVYAWSRSDVAPAPVPMCIGLGL